MSHPTVGAFVLAVNVMASTWAIAQTEVDPGLLGTWIGAGESNSDERVVVAKDHVVIAGERVPLRFVSPGVVEIVMDGEAERLSYRLKGGELLIRDSEETTTWRRARERGRVRPQRSDPRPDSGTSGLPREKPEGTVLLRKRTFRDPRFANIESHTMYLPAGWTGDAGVRWTNAYSNYAHFVGLFEGPDDLSITFDYNRYFGNSTYPDGMQQIRMAVDADRSGYSKIAWPPERQGQIAVDHIVPKLRPGARNVRMVDLETFPTAEAKLRELHAPILQQLQRGHTLSFHVQRVKVHYQQDGRPWEEIVQYVTAINRVAFRSRFVNSDTAITDVTEVRTFRAPRGELAENLRRMLMIAGTVRPTPRWSISVEQFEAEIRQIRHRGHMVRIRQTAEQARMIADANREISEIRMRQWRRDQEVKQSVHEATIDSILDVHDYRSRDSHPIEVDNWYERVFQDAMGNLIMTNDPTYDPDTDPNLTGDWARLERIRHLGR